MKKLLIGLLLAFPLTASADYKINKPLYELYDNAGFVLSFCRTSNGTCYEVYVFEIAGRGSYLALETTIDKRTYRGYSNACADRFYCRDRYVTASKNLKRELQADFPDIVVGDYVGNQNKMIRYIDLY